MATRNLVAMIPHDRTRTVRSRDYTTFLLANLFPSELDPLAPRDGALFHIGPIILVPAEWRNDEHINPSRIHARDLLGFLYISKKWLSTWTNLQFFFYYRDTLEKEHK